MCAGDGASSARHRRPVYPASPRQTPRTAGRGITAILRISMVWLNIVSHGRFSIIGNAPCFQHSGTRNHRQHDDEEHQHHRLRGRRSQIQSGKAFTVDLINQRRGGLNWPAGRRRRSPEGVEEGAYTRSLTSRKKLTGAISGSAILKKPANWACTRRWLRL